MPISLDWNESYRPVITPTRLYQGAMGRTIATLYNVFYAMGKNPIYLQASGAGYATVRTASFRLVRECFKGKDLVRGVLLDDDIWLDNGPEVLEIIKKADENHWNVVIPYMLADKSMSILEPPNEVHDQVKRLSVEEVANLDEYQEIWAAGLGFYYGDIPLTYEFHEGNPYMGEDLNFFNDNPQLHVRVAPARAMHAKTFLV